MVNSKRDISKSAHLKNGGQGAPNEVSFSVLDAKKIRKAEGEARGQGVAPLGRISLFTLGKHKPSSTPTKDKRITLSGDLKASDAARRSGGIYGAKNASGAAHARSAANTQKAASWEIPEETLKNRKRRRKHTKRMAATGTLLLCMCLIFAAVTFLSSQYQQQKETANQLELLIQDVYSEAESAVSYADYVDSLLLQPYSAEEVVVNYSEDEINGDFKNDLLSNLSQSKQEITSIQASLKSSKDVEAANSALEVINSLEKQLDLGGDVVALTEITTKCYALASDFLNDVLEADTLSRDATALAESLTDESAQASAEKSDEAREKFNTALAELTNLGELEEAFSAENDAVMSSYIEYVNMRIQSQQYAIESMQNYLSRNKDAMQTATDAFNSSESTAAELMSQLEIYPADLVKNYYSGKIDDTKARWDSEKGILAEALKQISTYVS
jgi:hypothetical protein